MKNYGRRKSDNAVRRIMGWAAHSILIMACAIWLTMLASIGAAELIHNICERNHSHSMVCTGIKQGLITE